MSWPCGVPQFCLLKVRCMVELGKKIDFYCNVVAHRSSDEMEKGMDSGIVCIPLLYSLCSS